MSTQRVVLKKRKGKAGKGPGNRQHVERFAGDAYSLAERTAKGLMAIKKLINIETKFVDLNGSANTFDSAGALVYASGITQGTDISQRVGDSIRMQRVSFSAWVRGGTSFVKTNARVLLVRDLENAGVIPVPSDILSGLSSTQSPMVPYNYINTRTRFSILFDEMLTLNSNGDASGVISYSESHAGHIRYRGTTNGIASAAQGSLFLLFVSNETTTLLPDVTYTLRIEFTDD